MPRKRVIETTGVTTGHPADFDAMLERCERTSYDVWTTAQEGFDGRSQNSGRPAGESPAVSWM